MTFTYSFRDTGIFWEIRASLLKWQFELPALPCGLQTVPTFGWFAHLLHARAEFMATRDDGNYRIQYIYFLRAVVYRLWPQLYISLIARAPLNRVGGSVTGSSVGWVNRGKARKQNGRSRRRRTWRPKQPTPCITIDEPWSGRRYFDLLKMEPYIAWVAPCICS